MDMVSLETLHLAIVTTRDGMLQQLLSSCPRLADLTLEECASVKELAVTSPWVRRFVMICCHNATGVELHTTLAQVAALQRRPSSSRVVVQHCHKLRDSHGGED
ncbi:hypothetical protein ZWY2020_019519 [Hordeum vulgare]|nr:hypothetical protein ZWY2020_019519 [Hordeum vulgare]